MNPSAGDEIAQGTTRRDILKWAALIGGGVASGGLLTACSAAAGKAEQFGPPIKGGTLVVGTQNVPPGFSPLYSNSQFTHWTMDPVMDALYTFDETMALVPQLAAEMPTESKDKLSWIVKIRPGVKFHNGDPLTAEHAVKSLQWACFSGGGSSQLITMFSPWVRAVSVVDDLTMKIDLSTPFGILPNQLARLPISHASAIEDKAAAIGCGPYKVDEVVSGQKIRLVRFDDYWSEAPPFDAIEIITVVDPSTRLVNLREGKIQVATNIQPIDVPIVQKDPSLELHDVLGTSGLRTVLNQHRKPFDSLPFRKALAFAMDRTMVVNAVFAGQAEPGQGILGPNVEGYDPDYKPFPEVADLEQAKKFLAESGVPAGTGFTILVSTSGPSKDVAQVLAQNWAALGLDVKLEVVDSAGWAMKWIGGDFDMTLTVSEFGISGGTVPLAQFTIYRSESRQNPGVVDPMIDEKYAALCASTDSTERAAIARELNRILTDQAVELPAAYPKLLVAQRRQVSELNENWMKFGRLNYRDISYLESKK